MEIVLKKASIICSNHGKLNTIVVLCTQGRDWDVGACVCYVRGPKAARSKFSYDRTAADATAPLASSSSSNVVVGGRRGFPVVGVASEEVEVDDDDDDADDDDADEEDSDGMGGSGCGCCSCCAWC